MIWVRASRIVPRLRRNGRAGADERHHALQSRYVVHTKYSVGALGGRDPGVYPHGFAKTRLARLLLSTLHDDS